MIQLASPFVPRDVYFLTGEGVIILLITSQIPSHFPSVLQLEPGDKGTPKLGRMPGKSGWLSPEYSMFSPLSKKVDQVIAAIKPLKVYH